MKNGTTMPCITVGRVGHAAGSSLKCSVCSGTWDGYDGELLHSLPSSLTAEHNVDPRFCTGRAHLSRDVSSLLESDMVKGEIYMI